MYEVNGWMKFLEEDNYLDGCIPETSRVITGDDRFVSSTVEYLVSKLKDFLYVTDDDCVELDACDEPGRIDIQVMEDDDAFVANAHDIERWKRGEQRLWLASYSFYVEYVVRQIKPLKSE